MDSTLIDKDLVTIEEAASMLGVEPKRLRGFIFRNNLADPIGDATHVYGWSCKTLAEKLITASSGELTNG